MKTKISTIIFLLFFCLNTNLSLASTGNIANLVFTTESQTIAPNEVSGSIIVQTQNSTGTSEAVDETNDVVFTSSSPTGRFVNSSGNDVSTTMSKNTSSRTFYYIDTTSGTFTITVKITGRTSGSSFTASQNIVVGDTNTGPSDSNTDDQNNNQSDTGSNNDNKGTSSTSTSISSHSNEVDISNYKYKVEFGADAGRQRVATINSPINFETRVGDFTSEIYARVESNWSFGDGTIAFGKDVTHTYEFEGEYNVVLNVNIGGSRAVSRTLVKVIKPDLNIVSFEKGEVGYVEIKNNSLDEINLQSYKLSLGNESFIFPLDTIISPGSIIKFPVKFYGSSSDLYFYYPNGKLLLTYAINNYQVSTLDTGYESRRNEAIKRLNDYLLYNQNNARVNQKDNLTDMSIVTNTLDSDDEIISTSTLRDMAIESMDERANSNLINKFIKLLNLE